MHEQSSYEPHFLSRQTLYKERKLANTLAVDLYRQPNLRRFDLSRPFDRVERASPLKTPVFLQSRVITNLATPYRISLFTQGSLTNQVSRVHFQRPLRVLYIL